MSEEIMDRQPELPGLEMLFSIPTFNNVYTRITAAIALSIICSLVVVFFKENRFISEHLKYLHINEIIYILVGFTMAEVSCSMLAGWKIIVD